MIYTVKKGDTLSDIGKRFNVTVEALAASNGIQNKNLIRVGQILIIPTNTTKDYAAIGKSVENVLKEIESLPSYAILYQLLYG